MPRRLIIGILVVLILGIVGGTIVLVMRRIQGPAEPTNSPSPSAGALPPSSSFAPVVNPDGDDDGDQLSNGQEAVWGTNPTNPDTDGDSYPDGKEVLAQYNPTIASPNDKLPADFKPGQNLQPLDPARQAPLAVDQFFVDDLDLTLGTTDYTAAYQKEYPADQRTPDTLVAFATAQPVITNLPRPAEKSILRQATDGPLSLAAYLQIAGNLEVFSNPTELAQAIDNVFSHKNPQLLNSLASQLRIHQENLIQQPVPPSAVALHQLLLGYTELLAATYDQIARYSEDPVRAVVAMHQFEQIDSQYIPLIEQEVDRLEALSAQLNGDNS